MLTRTSRFVAITCAALVLGLTHALEAPGKALFPLRCAVVASEQEAMAR